MKLLNRIKKWVKKSWDKSRKISYRASMRYFRKAEKLRVRADRHERKACTPSLILKVCSEKFAKLEFNRGMFSDEVTGSIFCPMCEKIEYTLPRRKGWGKPISKIMLSKLKRDRDFVEAKERKYRRENMKGCAIVVT